MAGEYSANVYMEQGGDSLVIGSSGYLKFGTVAQTGCVRAGIHTVSSAEATANTLDITTGLTTVSAHLVQILRAGAVATSDAAVSESSGTLTVADGSTYDVTADDAIHWFAIGT